MPDKVLTCKVWDSSTSTCTTQAWDDPPSLLPNMPIADAMVIIAKMFFCFTLAFCFRELYRSVRGR